MAAEALAPVTLMTAVTNMADGELSRRRFEIDRQSSPITAGDLRTLLNLPYEVSLHEQEGRVILNRGTETDIYDTGATHEARWLLHTHPFGSENTGPSNTDVMATWQDGYEHVTHLLVTEKGVLTYRAPQHEPNRPELPIADKMRTIGLWGYGSGVPSVFINAGALTSDQQIAQMRQFCEQTGMIVDEAAWDDQEGLERALAVVNGSAAGVDAVGDIAVHAARKMVDTPVS